MSDTTAQSPRPVSLVTIVFVLALFAVFALLVSHYYTPTATAPENQVAENFPMGEAKDAKAPKNPTEAKEAKNLAPGWNATPATRRQALADLREKQARQAASYGWVDQKAGVVQLPIERAMELTVQQYGAKK